MYKTCDGTFDPETAPLMAAAAQSKGPTKKISEDEEWWRSFAERAEKSDLNIRDIDYGGKIVLLLQIIGERTHLSTSPFIWIRILTLYYSNYSAHCDAIGDKVVVFSQSLPTLSYIEEVLNSPDWMGFKLFLPENTAKQIGGWKRNEEYLRIDGVSAPLFNLVDCELQLNSNLSSLC
jgi:hypothetical protein